MSRRGENRSDWPRRVGCASGGGWKSARELKPPPRAARRVRRRDSGYACASLDTLGRVGCYRARGLHELDSSAVMAVAKAVADHLQLPS